MDNPLKNKQNWILYHYVSSNINNLDNQRFAFYKYIGPTYPIDKNQISYIINTCVMEDLNNSNIMKILNIEQQTTNFYKVTLLLPRIV